MVIYYVIFFLSIIASIALFKVPAANFSVCFWRAALRFAAAFLVLSAAYFLFLFIVSLFVDISKPVENPVNFTDFYIRRLRSLF